MNRSRGSQDAARRLVSVRDRDGKTRTFGYDPVHKYLESEHDRRGNRVFFNEYDASGRAIRQTDAKAGVTTFAWDEPTQTMTITDPSGARVARWRRERGSPPGSRHAR